MEKHIPFIKTDKKLYLIEKINFTMYDFNGSVKFNNIIGITDDMELAMSYQDVFTKITEIPFIERK
jgi:hypothetical protein